MAYLASEFVSASRPPRGGQRLSSTVTGNGDLFWSVPVADLLSSLASNAQGLTNAEAERRLADHGPNTIGTATNGHIIRLLLRQFGSPIVLLLIAAACLSVLLHDPTDGAIILGIVFVSGMLGFWQEHNASNIVEALLSKVELQAAVIRAGREARVPVAAVVPGDIVTVSAGSGIPADCRVLESRDLFVNEAALTGESYPVEKSDVQLAGNTPLAGRANALFMGTHAVSGTARALVVRTGRDTEFGRLSAIPMLFDTVGRGLWLAFRDGSGVAYFKDGRVVAAYSGADGLGRGMVGHLQLDADGAVWVATEGGLSRIKGGRIHTLTAKSGLPCDPVHWTIEDVDHRFWLYTACGLARIARSQLDAWAATVDRDKDAAPRIDATLFDGSDGVRIHAAPGGYSPQVGKSPDGRIWFLPWDGVSVLDPRRLPFNHLPPPVHIEQIIADGRSYAPISPVRLPALARDLAIDYTALSLLAPERIRFRYKLEGQDPEWREVLNERRVQYSNLGPGTYRFRVVASNNSGVWNETGASLQFAILPAYYQTTWFRALSLGVLLSMIGVAYGFRIRQLRHEQRKLREIVDSIPAIAGIARPDGSNEYLNQRWVEFTGLPAVAASGSGWHVAVHPDDKDRYVVKWSASLTRGEPFEIEARFRSAQSEYRWFLVRAVPVRDKNGKICNWYAVMTDIEDRKNVERQLEALSGRLISAQEEERSRIARELHDDISQSLGLLAITIDQLRADPEMPAALESALERLKQDTGEVAADVHRLSHQLHSSTLDYLGLIPALKRLIADFSTRHEIAVALEDQSLSSTLPSDVALCLFRIVQESLNNIAKHSQAHSARVRVGRTAEGVHLTIEDDGIGFEVTDFDTHAGLGFVSMRERLRPLHGTVRVDSAPGRGTRIDVYAPVTSLDASESSVQAVAHRSRAEPANN